ncbi:MAG: hypothetical protein U0R19_05395 [Bryobacteraceae bacterium]
MWWRIVSAFYLDKTPVLLMEPLRVEQLRKFSERLRIVQSERAAEWALPEAMELEQMFEQYSKSRRHEREIPVLGVPFWRIWHSGCFRS